MYITLKNKLVAKHVLHLLLDNPIEKTHPLCTLNATAEYEELIYQFTTDLQSIIYDERRAREQMQEDINPQKDNPEETKL